MTDRDLLHALRSSRVRPSEAYARLFDAYGEELYELCWTLLGDADVAQTVLRDTFIVTRAHIDRLPSERRFRDWLFAVAEAECERHLRVIRAEYVAEAPEPGVPRPPCLRVRVLSGVTGPDLSGYRAHIAQRADAFDRQGFPVPPSARHSEYQTTHLLPGLVVAACALLIVVLAVYLITQQTPEDTASWIIDPNTHGSDG
ncbi:DNA-directed RNA polymerase specialized sigma24 family protein [Lipingzhangella halophila]|uniref:DNA-directed RNA polymerase specialized sigma24 family protein n=1 Tax=Lipingzhangella halophila TaxID=1783352 RepID=A0A7W7RC36_9ACTN|nr:sigma-70 family RNA polymerase sigma factor [Lipingzhangella halophila]MBB4929237.1 DNA-directed RNA polymerase specialized sigma24 family protein [Lipingzhangella halophila]